MFQCDCFSLTFKYSSIHVMLCSCFLVNLLYFDIHVKLCFSFSVALLHLNIDMFNCNFLLSSMVVFCINVISDGLL